MARCDEGYRCDVCGRDVEAITDSDLYLRYVLGEVPGQLKQEMVGYHVDPDSVVDPDFEPVTCDGPFAKAGLDPEFVRAEEERVTRGWRRLRAIPHLGLTLAEYPLSVTPEE